MNIWIKRVKELKIKGQSYYNNAMQCLYLPYTPCLPASQGQVKILFKDFVFPLRVQAVDIILDLVSHTSVMIHFIIDS